MLLAGGSVAMADHSETLMELDFTTTKKTRNAGTRTNPSRVVFEIAIDQRTTTGTGRPATSTDLHITLPAQFRWQGKRWPRGKRCDPVKANNARSDSACPARSSVGGGHVTAVAGDGSLVEEIDVRAYVTTGGDLGLWLDSEPTAPTPINAMLIGEISRARIVRVAIPPEIQEPLVGVPAAIDKLNFSLRGTARIKGDPTGIVESTGCRRGRWTLVFKNVYRHGSITDSDTAPCRP